MTDVVISPSSQTANQYAGGAAGVEDSESRWMRELCDILTPLLKRNGLDVVDLRSTDLATRIKESNKIGPLLHLAVHSNAGGGHGSGFYIYGWGGKSEPIARAMAAAMAPVTPTADDGVIVYNHYETRETTSPAVIAEVEFHDNAVDAQWIRTHLREIAVGLARGVIAGLAAAYGGRFVDIAARPLILDAGTGSAPVVVAPSPTPTPTPAVPEEDDMALAPNESAALNEIRGNVQNMVRWLTEGSLPWIATLKAQTAATADVDEAALAAQIAAAIPDTLAARVADELARRLAG